MNVQEMINTINSEKRREKNSGARFKKCIFHIHTPASYDYGLFEKSDVSKISLEQIEGLLVKKGFPINYLSDHGFDSLLEVDSTIFSVIQQGLFFLMAFVLLKEEVEIAVVMDHNTIQGVKQLQATIDKLYKEKSIDTPVYTHVVPGIEISCSDKNHVAAFFPDDMKELEDFYIQLQKTIVDEEGGTYEPSLHVLKMITENSGVGYIAHANSSNVFKDSLSGAYKKELFSLTSKVLLGLHDITEKNTQYYSDKINEIRSEKSPILFILDEDSHTINDLGTKPMWIKGKKVGFKMLVTALNDYNQSFSLSLPKKPESYISALFVEGCGFLKCNNNAPLVFKFSERMNAFIGGRGSGKSTVLNCLDYLTSQHVSKDSILKNIFSQGSILVEYVFNGKKYYISNLGGDPEYDQIEEEIERRKGQNDYNHNAKLRYKRKRAIRDSIQLWRYDGKELREVTKKKTAMLDAMFINVFAISDLVNAAESRDKLNNFIQEIFEKQEIISNKPRARFREKKVSLNTIKYAINRMKIVLEKRRDNIDQVLLKLNSENMDMLNVSYFQLEQTNYHFPWEKIFNLSPDNAHKFYNKFGISRGELVNFLNLRGNDVGIWNLIMSIIDESYDTIGFKELKQFLPIDFEVLSSDKLNLSEFENVSKLFKELRRLLKINVHLTLQEINDYYTEIDIFELKFNINNNSLANSKKAVWKKVSDLSMGQKVVALLNFILAYNNFIGDTTPLVIDQPEDNLDNVYIYDNLVKKLRETKGTRQIIVATHNSTIVMNSGTEQVFVLKSNSDHGWLDKAGFSGDRHIKKEVVNILEGGPEAYKRKVSMYEEII
ncbi:Spaf_1101 family AAA-like ATPase [Enterococcus sp. DIV1297f]|uniref:Spaf_1101 family AAA-like ATPase n=1 Tax=Enterococcus sp. DIV1297f TaxID=2774691 RepID=UPI003D2C8AF6